MAKDRQRETLNFCFRKTTSTKNAPKTTEQPVQVITRDMVPKIIGKINEAIKEGLLHPNLNCDCFQGRKYSIRLMFRFTNLNHRRPASAMSNITETQLEQVREASNKLIEKLNLEIDECYPNESTVIVILAPLRKKIPDSKQPKADEPPQPEQEEPNGEKVKEELENEEELDMIDVDQFADDT